MVVGSGRGALAAGAGGAGPAGRRAPRAGRVLRRPAARFRPAARLVAGAPAFRRRVLEHTNPIPYGQTLSYQDVAGLAGNPRPRGRPGRRWGRNPIPLVVPCHRVLRTGGALGGYGGGLELSASCSTWRAAASLDDEPRPDGVRRTRPRRHPAAVAQRVRARSRAVMGDAEPLGSHPSSSACRPARWPMWVNRVRPASAAGGLDALVIGMWSVIAPRSRVAPPISSRSAFRASFEPGGWTSRARRRTPGRRRR